VKKIGLPLWVKTKTRPWWGWVGIASALLLGGSCSFVQAQTTAMISGTVADSSGGVVPGAKVTATNQTTQNQVETVTGSSGAFTFPVLLPGSYTIRIEAKGFEASQQEGITANAGARMTLPDVALRVGNVSQTVTVQTSEQPLQTDNGQLGAVLSTKDIEQLALVSQNALELLKVLPGVTSIAPGIGNGLNFDFLNVGVEGSPLGFGLGSNGTPAEGGTANLLDGVNINDPGCNCWSIATILPDMVREVSFQSSNFGADVSHGPVVISSISKSGTDRYHGEAYFYARNDVLNANDWVSNNERLPRGHADYYYPGGNFGGPIPYTHKKLLYWFGFERFIQNTGNANSLISHIPTSDMLAGNFTATAANTALCPNGIGSGNTGTYCNDLTGTRLPDGTTIGVTPGVPAGRIPPQFLSTTAAQYAQILTKIWPAPNVTPTASNGYANFFQAIPGVHDGYIWRARLDYSLGKKASMYVSYQYGTDQQLSGGTGAKAYSSPANAIPFPGGPIGAPDISKILTGHLTYIFTDTLTNELVGSLGYADNPVIVPKPSAVFKSTLGYGGGTIFNTGDSWIPSYNSAGPQTFPDFSQTNVFNNGTYALIKETPSVYDNLIKVWHAHTVKLGAFYETVDNNQGNRNVTNGLLSFNGGPAPNAVTNIPVGSPNNPTANLVLGNVTGYVENSANPRSDLAYKTFSIYAADSWRITRRLNLEFGFRFDHNGRWYDRGTAGLPVFLPAKVANDFYSGNVTTPGLSWHGINPGIPKSGNNAPFLSVAPRLGLSYDLHNDGQTVFRGGWGRYHWGDQWDDVNSAAPVAQGVQSYALPNNTTALLDQLGTGLPNVVTGDHNLSPASRGVGCCAGSATTIDPNDHNVPRTDSYNFTIDQRAPWNSLIEISYVGNQTSNALIGGNNGATLGPNTDYINQNKMPLGALFKPDPITGVTVPNPENIGGPGSPLNKAADYQPYGFAYGSNPIYMLTHGGYSNYNGLQLSWVKRSNHLTFNLNYAHSKALGTNLAINPFSLHANYGVEALDRPNVFNSSYSYNVLDFYHGGNKLVSGAINNWLISGITTWQGGGNLQALLSNGSSPNFGMTLTYNTSSLPSGVNPGYGAPTYYGTTAVMAVMPITTCDPGSGLANNQHVKASCFAPPAIGAYGPRNYPYLSGPAYLDADLAIAKTFHVRENDGITFRASAFDWINHPLPAFSTSRQLTLFYNTDYSSKTTVLSSSTSPTFGTTDTKTGGDTRRVIELELKYHNIQESA
jgi:Carboxypeptidase regulatory-like domain